MNAFSQPRTRQRIATGLLLLLASVAAYLWHGRLRADSALEEASVEALQKITQERPGYARAFYYLGMKLNRAGQPGPAFDALSRAADLDPDDEQTWALAAGVANGLNGPEAAFRIMNDFLKRHPDSRKMQQERHSLLHSLKRAAEGFARAGRHAEALKFYRQWLAEEPESAAARQGYGALQQTLGLDLLERGNRERAFLALEEAVRHDPQLWEARMALATMYFEAHFHPQAIAQMKEVVRIVPDNAKAWHMLGRISSGAEPKEAEAALANAVKHAPKSAHAYLDLAALQVTNLKPREAEANYRMALKLAPRDPAVLTQLGGFLLSDRTTEERRTEAETRLRQAVALDPRSGDARYHLGRLALERRNAREAVASLEKALSLPLEEDEAAVWYALSRAYGLVGDSARAEAARKRSRRIREEKLALARAEEEAYMNPRDPGLRFKVARLYAKHGEHVKAISQYQGGLSLNPNDTDARREFEAFTTRLRREGRLPDMRLFQAMVAASSQAR